MIVGNLGQHFLQFADRDGRWGGCGITPRHDRFGYDPTTKESLIMPSSSPGTRSTTGERNVGFASELSSIQEHVSKLE